MNVVGRSMSGDHRLQVRVGPTDSRRIGAMPLYYIVECLECGDWHGDGESRTLAPKRLGEGHVSTIDDAIVQLRYVCDQHLTRRGVVDLIRSFL